MLCRVLLVIFIFGLKPLDGSPDLCKPLTLVELIDIALENHPSTRQAWWNAWRAAATLGTANSAFYPHLDASANASHGRTFKFVNGPDANYTIVGADLILSILLYDYGARNANRRGAKDALAAANWQSDWTIQKVLVRVLENAYALMHAQEVYQATCISANDAEKMLYTARELNRTGLSPISDVYTTEATFSQMKMEVMQQKALVGIQKGKLAASLGLSADTPLVLADIEGLPPPHLQKTSALIELASQKRADLFAKQANVAEAFSRLDRARAAYGPKVSLKGSGGGSTTFHHREDNLQYKLMLNFDMPLFNGFETFYQNRTAYADIQISMEEMHELELNIALEVLTYSKSLEASQEMLPEAEINLKNAIQAYEGVLERYKAGKEGIAELSNALRQLASARVRLSDVKTRWRVSLANLAYATGTLMENQCALPN